MIAEQTDPHEIYAQKYEEPQRHFDALLSASVVTLDIRPRLLYPLWDAGVRTVGDLIDMHRIGLRAVRNIGTEAAAEIELLLFRADLTGVARP